MSRVRRRRTVRERVHEAPELEREHMFRAQRRNRLRWQALFDGDYETANRMRREQRADDDALHAAGGMLHHERWRLEHGLDPFDLSDLG